MATVTTKKNGTQKRVAINGDVQLKSTYSVTNNTKERPAVKLLSCCFVSGAMTFKVRVGNIYVWLQKGSKVKNFHSIDFVEPVRNYERYDENNKILVATSRTHRISNLYLPNEYENAEILFKIKESNKHQLSPFGAIAIKK